MARKVMQRNYDNEGKLVSKECSCCHKVKPVSEFNKDNRAIDGLKSKCKQCNKQYYQNNRENILKQQKQYNKDNKKKRKQYYQDNKEHFKEYKQKYYQDNAENISEKNKKQYTEQIKIALKKIKQEIEKEPEKYNYNPNKNIHGIIYLVHNIESDKYYVGQTTIGFDNRYNKGWLYEHSYKDAVEYDLKLYGEESFEYTKLFKVAYSQYELDKLEAYYIDYYNSYEKGYNENRGNIFTNRGKEDNK